MNAVLDKPRAKAAKRPATAQKSAPPPVTIADICSWICTAEQKLEMAYDAAERGAPIDTLLDHINHNVLCGPFAAMHREDLTQADAKRIYTGLFPVLACLHGAIKLAEGTVLQSTLEEAFALLDAAQTALDPVNDAVRALPEGGPAHDFERGRDLAIRFINEGSSLSGQRDCYRDHRDPGTAQKDFAGEYLMEAVEARELLSGFAAVLSQVIGSGEGFDGEFFANLTLAETEAGEPGEDGTQVLADDAVATTASGPATEFFGHETFDDVCCTISEVIAIIQARAHEVPAANLIFGAVYTTQRAYDILSEGISARDVRLCEDASAPLAVALAVLGAGLEKADDVALFGAERLLALAKERLEEACIPSTKGQR
jgi:hypothetical protein